MPDAQPPTPTTFSTPRTYVEPDTFFRHVATVSPTFLCLRQPYCLHCAAPWETLDFDAIQYDAQGEYVACPACTALYRPRGGRFIDHGEIRPERWCGRCQMWRPVDRPKRSDANNACIACGTLYDFPCDPPEQALLDECRMPAAKEG